MVDPVSAVAGAIGQGIGQGLAQGIGEGLGRAIAIVILIIFCSGIGLANLLLIGLKCSPRRTAFTVCMSLLSLLLLKPLALSSGSNALFILAIFSLFLILSFVFFRKDEFKWVQEQKWISIILKLVSGICALIGIMFFVGLSGALGKYVGSDLKLTLLLLFPAFTILVGLLGMWKG